MKKSGVSFQRTQMKFNHLEAGLAHHRAGRYAEASACYAAVLRANPEHADALNLTGVLARQRGDLSLSVRLIRKAIESEDSVATYHHNLGRTYGVQGRRDEAILSYRKAIELNARDAESIQMLAGLLAEGGNLSEACLFYRRLTELQPDQPEVYSALGNSLQLRGQIVDALDCYCDAAKRFPNNPDVHFNLAKAQYEYGQLSEAAESYRQVLRMSPEDAEAHNCLGRVLHELSEVEVAKQSYLNALKVKADFPEAMSNLGALLMDVGELKLAENFLSRAIALKPNLLNAYCNLASVLARQGNALGAIEALRKVLQVDPQHAEALCTFGYVFDTLGDEDGAVTCFRTALASQPNLALARFNLSSHILAAGNFIEGWKEYEMRWQVRQFAGAPRNFKQARWQGQELRGSSIYVYAEQGLGDTIQFARYAIMLAERGAEVTLEVQPLLKNVLREFHSSVEVICKGEQSSRGTDYHCPLLSLPGIVGTDITSIPSCTAYLNANACDVAAWSSKMNTADLRVGIVWSGNPEHTRDRMRSIPFKHLSQILQIRGVTFYSLQKGPAAAHSKDVEVGRPLFDLDPQLNDFTDTAAVIANLDLVISVDTSVAHLAAALGKPVWLLLHHAPDWRWLRNREDSPWYPTMRLFTQFERGDWKGVLANVREELQQKVNAHFDLPPASLPIEQELQSA